jgi:flagellar export protein FliJ
MDGIDQLNKIRSSPNRTNLEALEASLDHVKNQWQELFKAVQALETREKAQIARLMEAERELKAVERLSERYERDFKKEMSRSEQKMLDEIAIRQFNAQSRN